MIRCLWCQRKIHWWQDYYYVGEWRGYWGMGYHERCMLKKILNNDETVD